MSVKQNQDISALLPTLPSMAGKTVAITGCTSGTGLILAQRCGALGCAGADVKSTLSAQCSSP